MQKGTLIKVGAAALVLYLIFKGSSKKEPEKKAASGGGGGGGSFGSAMPLFNMGLPSQTTVNTTVIGPNSNSPVDQNAVNNAKYTTTKETTGTGTQTSSSGAGAGTGTGASSSTGGIGGGGAQGGGMSSPQDTGSGAIKSPPAPLIGSVNMNGPASKKGLLLTDIRK